MKSITLDQVKHIFRTENGKHIPLLEKRVEVIQVSL